MEGVQTQLILTPLSISTEVRFHAFLESDQNFFFAAILIKSQFLILNLFTYHVKKNQSSLEICVA